jgi:hypothetical protein
MYNVVKKTRRKAGTQNQRGLTMENNAKFKGLDLVARLQRKMANHKWRCMVMALGARCIAQRNAYREVLENKTRRENLTARGEQ